MNVLNIHKITELEDMEFNIGMTFPLISKDIGIDALLQIKNQLNLDISKYHFMLLAYNKTAMFVHALDLVTDKIVVKNSNTRFFIVTT